MTRQRLTDVTIIALFFLMLLRFREALNRPLLGLYLILFWYLHPEMFLMCWLNL